MQPLKLWILILVNFALNIQSIPLKQCSDVIQKVSLRNPEYNYGFVGGDMILEPSSKGRGVAIRPATGNRWPGGVIPYEFASNITYNNSIFIETQMRAMENLTQCIKFRPKNVSDQFFITIFNGSGCYAAVGSWGNYVGIRPVSLLDSPLATCMVSGIVQHELTHVLGFYHEQSRPDRDSFVTIKWENVDPAQTRNFDKYNDSEVDTQGTPYDYGSVMHYDRYAFAINPSIPTITPIQNTSAFIGQRIGLSPIDILEIQRYYGCVSTPYTTTTVTTITSSITTSPVIATTITSPATAATTTLLVTTATTTSPITTTTTIITSSVTTTTITSSITITTSMSVRDTIPSHFTLYIVWLLLVICFSNYIR